MLPVTLECGLSCHPIRSVARLYTYRDVKLFVSSSCELEPCVQTCAAKSPAVQISVGPAASLS